MFEGGEFQPELAIPVVLAARMIATGLAVFGLWSRPCLTTSSTRYKKCPVIHEDARKRRRLFC